MSKLQRTPPPVSTVDSKRQRTDDDDDDDIDDDQGCEMSGAAGSASNENSTTLKQMMRMMMMQFAETKDLIDKVRNEVKDVNSKIDAVKTELKSDIQSVKDECAAKFQNHDAALVTLNKRVDGVSQKIGALENRNELVISGIPSRTSENLKTTLKEIGRHLAVKDSTTLAAEIRRLKSGANSDGDGLIVVEFPLKATRDEFYNAYLRKRDLKLNHIGLDSDRRVYINESLTIEARKLKKAALQLKKVGKLASVYTKQGVVHVKTAVGGPSIAVQSEEELDNFT